MKASRLVVASALLWVGTASAERLDLSVHRVPTRALPATLAMRAASEPDAGPTAATRSLRERAQDALARSFLSLPDELTDLDERVVFHLDVGIGLDGGEPAGRDAALRGGDRPLVELDGGPNGFYERLRIYTFGDAVIGSRGLLMPSLSTYFASQFRFSQGSIPATSAVPTVYDGASSGDALLIRHAYAELHDVFEHPRLAGLYLRAGRQFRYSAAIAHFDGATIGYDGKAFSFGAFSGQRVSLYGLGRSSVGGGLIAGSTARINLFHLKRVPIVLGGEFLRFDDVQHFQGEIGLRFGRDVLLRGHIRSYGNSLAQERVNLRARLSKVTTLQVAFDNRHTGDWSYDLIAAEGRTLDSDDPRRFLALGMPRPRARLSLRAGTVLFDNLDLLARAAIAREHGEETPSAFHRSYSEAGMAFSMRFRRSLRVGSSVLARRYSREEPGPVPVLGDGTPDVLPADTGALGERSFVEADLDLAYNLGARSFDARAGFYTRAYRTRNPLEAPLDSTLDVRSGLRLSVEGWATQNLRMKGEYETTFLPDYLAPEIRSARSLRVLLEATF